jgi:hypothetical protein
MGDERQDRKGDEGQDRDGSENPQDEREGGYGAPAEREEQMKQEGPGREKEGGAEKE